MSRRNFFIFFSILISSSEIQSGRKDAVIIWNVGQGQWITYVQFNKCEHFDMGGEHWNLEGVKDHCSRKFNRIHFTHLDKDHYSFTRSFFRSVTRACLDPKILTFSDQPAKRLRKFLTICSDSNTLPNYEVSYSFENLRKGFGSQKFNLNRNDLSRVFHINNFMLIPGDSTKKAEKLWSRNLKNESRFKVLVLGHHGSNTSTSNELLIRLPHLKLAIASSRKRRYGHPHYAVAQRLQMRAISLISTEDWGTIAFELKPKL